jgi:integrase
MDAVTETKTVTGDINGILTDYHVKMKLNGYKAATVEMSWKILELLIKRGADLTKPETVKKVIAEQNWSGNRRRNVINSYNQLAKYLGISWEQPKNTVTRKIPFIPTEQEIDDLIAGCPITLAVFLQILKETALRSGEAIKLKWRDVDLERRVITCNDPEKGSDSRQFSELSGKLLNMLAKYHKTTNTFLEQKPKTA